MNELPLVSVVVPVYNVEKYIERCVKSILNQSYKNIEIVLVDDGSTDKSSRIIDNIAKNEDNVVVVHKKNSGVSSARNVGIDTSSGDYIMFVDGDDWVEVDYISCFLDVLIDTNSVIAMNTNYFYDNGVCKKDFDGIKVLDSDTVAEYIYRGKIFVAVWNKIYSANFLKNHNIRFNENIWFGEGMLFNIDCLAHVRKVAVIGRNLYHQVANPNSAMRNFNIKSYYCGIESLKLQKKTCAAFSCNVNNALDLHMYGYNRSIIEGLVRTDNVKNYKDEYYKCIKQLRKNIMIPLKYEESLKSKIKWLLYFINPGFMAKIMIKRTNKH